MAAELRSARATSDGGEVARARMLTRLVVLPFRLLRPDPETDFLGFSLPDAITTSLSSVQSLVVRSSLTASRLGGDPSDLRKIGAEADVDVALCGTLLRAGDALRLNAQLVEVPGGAVVWSHTAQVTMGDVFQLQDALTQRIVQSLAVPLSVREARLLRRDVPGSARAYEFFLRANDVANDAGTWSTAYELYRQSLDDDPRFAPARARLGRVCRVMAKYRPDGARARFAEAEAAVERALELNPDLPLAHHVCALLEIDLGRAEAAVVRLVERAKVHGADSEIFAALVYACRFCGLLGASVAADTHARRLDPTVRTSVAHTHWQRRDYARVLTFPFDDIPYIGGMSLAMLGRTDDALEAFRRLEARVNRVPDLVTAARALLEDRREDSIAALERATATVRDPEGLFYVGRQHTHLREADRALLALERAVAGGFFSFPFMADDPWLEPLADHARFADLRAHVEQRHRAAAEQFERAGGPALLGSVS
jgi:TolB-like protein